MCLCAEGIWCDVGSCRRVSGVMCTFRWLSEQNLFGKNRFSVLKYSEKSIFRSYSEKSIFIIQGRLHTILCSVSP